MQWERSLADIKPACQGGSGAGPSGKGTKQDRGQNGRDRGRGAELYKQFNTGGQTEDRDKGKYYVISLTWGI